eukprot:m.23699 g.23699  ORF g.23699 m.23699 type:complete len:1206 (+) comp8561_c0_seq1:1327-4944(+)
MDFELTWGCDACGASILPSKNHYCCITCTEERLDNTFDLCADCVGYHTEKHAISAPFPGRFPLPAKPCFIDVLYKKIQQNAFRKFIGVDLQNGRWKYTTYMDVYNQARSLATFVEKLLGPTAQPKYIAMSSANRSEWIVADFASAFGGHVSVPIHTTADTTQLAAMLQHSGSQVFVCDNTQLTKLRQASVELGALPVTHVIAMDLDAKQLPTDTFALHSWPAATAIPSTEWSPMRPAKSGSELRTLLYTSGSTGTPKAAMITDTLLLAELDRRAPFEPFVTFAFLPLAYSTQRVIMLETFANGGRMCCWDGNMETFFDQLAATQVSTLSAPPRVWNMLYSLYQARVALAEPLPPRDEATQKQVEKKVTKEMLKIFGRNCMAVSTGGSTTSPAVLEWMATLFKETAVRVSEGYGITEVGTIASNGIRVMECQVHLEDVPEMGYLTTDKPRARGLLWVHTPTMSTGYHGDEAATALNFKDIHGDGVLWFNTGDIVEYDPRLNDLIVIDRKKNFIKLSTSLFVAPDHIENVLTTCPLVTNIWAYAAIGEDCVLAVVHPNRELFSRQAAAEQIPFETFEELCAHPAAASLMQRALASEGARRLQPHEIPRAVVLEPVPWSPETGELTVSLKLARIALTHKYRSRLTAIYDRLAGRAVSATPAPSPMEGVVSGTSHVDAAQNGNHEAGTHVPAAPALPPGGISNATPSRATAQLADKRAQFAKVVSEVTNTSVDQLNWDATLAECGLDSTSVVLLISLLKSHHISVPWDRLYRTPLREIAAGIEQGDAENARALVTDWSAECRLPADVTSLCSSFFGRRFPSNISEARVFLTGATGFLGASILRELLLSGVHVVCLARAKDNDDAMRRVIQAADFFGFRDDIGPVFYRLNAIAGDFSLPQFGLSDTAWAGLVSGLHAIIHNGARVNGVLPYAVLRDDNVQSTITCIALAARAGAKLLYVSSLSSLSTLEQGEESPTPLPTGPLGLMSGYGATKRVSEILIHRAFLAGMKSCCVVRPGTIGPCARTGCLSPGDTLTRLLQSVVQLGAVPISSVRMSMCSVTDIAQLCSRLVLDPTPLSTRTPTDCLPTINMFGPSDVFLDALGEAARASGRLVAKTSMADFLSRVRAARDEKQCALKPIQSYFDGGMFPLSTESFSSASAMRHCAHLNVTRNNITLEDLKRSLRWMEEHDMLPPLSRVSVIQGRRVRESWT